jgi:dolichol-phosphate mannosyltransferase
LTSILDFLRRLLTKEQRRFIKFCIVGASGVPVNLLFTFIGHRFAFAAFSEDARKAAAFLLGIAVSILTNFLLNDVWTWKDRERVKDGFFGRMARFYLVCSAASALQFGTAMALSVWLRLHYLLAQLAGIALATVVNYIANNLWTYRRKTPAPPPDERSGDEGDPTAPGA